MGLSASPSPICSNLDSASVLLIDFCVFVCAPVTMAYHSNFAVVNRRADTHQWDDSTANAFNASITLRIPEQYITYVLPLSSSLCLFSFNSSFPRSNGNCLSGTLLPPLKSSSSRGSNTCPSS